MLCLLRCGLLLRSHTLACLPVQRVVHALEAASVVMSELAKQRDDVDKQLLHAAATGFIQQIQEAQAMVLEAVQTAAPDREFEANNYFLMVQVRALWSVALQGACMLGMVCWVAAGAVWLAPQRVWPLAVQCARRPRPLTHHVC